MSDRRAFVGGDIRTMDPVRRHVECVVIEGDRIVAVGDRALARAMPDAVVVDLGGRTLVPGFIDAHNHLSIAALHPVFGNASAAATPEALVDCVRDHAAAAPEADWVRVAGWNDVTPAFTVDRRLLDDAVADRPVILAHYSLHQCVANSRALELLGIGRATPDPAGGEIGRDETGAPSGLLLERAWSDAHARSLAAYADPDRWADHIGRRARGLWAEGITAVHDAACAPAAEAVYRAMAANRTLPISVLALPHPAALLTNDPAGRLDGPPTGDGDETLRIGPIKLFADGGITIALDAYVGGHHIRYGSVMGDVADRAGRAADRGFDLAVHAIGNAGVAHALDALEAVSRRHDVRTRIEHATVTGPGEWVRMAALGSIAVVQPGFVEHVGCQSGGVRFDDAHWLAMAGLTEAGVTIAGSSDDPCAPVDPLWCMARGIDRTTSTGIVFEPEQSVPFDAWLDAYTINAARAGGQESERGSLTPGKRADLVILDTGTDGARGAVVTETWIAGSRVYDAAEAASAATNSSTSSAAGTGGETMLP